MQFRYIRASLAGVVGALAMSAVGLWGAPLMGMPKMNPAEMLAMKMGGVVLLGWAGHLMIGVVLALVYATVAVSRLPGPSIVRGMLFSLAPWLMAQVAVMPMIGMPVFSGSISLAMGSLIGHMVYGALVGDIVGKPHARNDFTSTTSTRR